MTGAYEAVLARRSWSKVTDDAPTDEELERLVAAAGRVADHKSLRPWRLITLRGDDRLRLGRALAKADGDKGVNTKPLRAPLLVAVVFSRVPGDKVPAWEQHAVASGVAHVLSLLLDDAGWGVIWRTGDLTQTTPVAEVHGLGATEELLGWLYVGGKPEKNPGSRRPIDAATKISPLPASGRSEEHAAASGGDAAGTSKKKTSPKKADERARKEAKKARKKAAKKAEKKQKKSGGPKRKKLQVLTPIVD